ncbi:putative ureidoglycolate hydrolase, partial [Trifolium pratense]
MESLKVVTLKPIEATPSSFKDYGQVIEPSPDDQRFGPHDAQLDLTQGIP